MKLTIIALHLPLEQREIVPYSVSFAVGSLLHMLHLSSFLLLLFSVLAERSSTVGFLALVLLLRKVSLFLMSSAPVVPSLRRSTPDLLVFHSLH